MGQDKSRVLTENIVETQKDMNDDVLMSSHVLAIGIKQYELRLDSYLRVLLIAIQKTTH